MLLFNYILKKNARGREGERPAVKGRRAISSSLLGHRSCEHSGWESLLSRPHCPFTSEALSGYAGRGPGQELTMEQGRAAEMQEGARTGADYGAGQGCGHFVFRAWQPQHAKEMTASGKKFRVKTEISTQ